MTELEIDAFLNVIKYGSITKAAEVLYISQPALSRRIKSLEDELEYKLFIRQKGVRNVELTPQGEAFVLIAEKWKELLLETKNISQATKHTMFHICAIDSINTYILPKVYKTFIEKNNHVHLIIHNLHSQDSYTYIENKIVNLGFISDDMYNKDVKTVPIFSEKMCFISNKENNYPTSVHPSNLDCKLEIKLPWNPEFDKWHNYWFGATSKSLIIVDKMSILDDFLQIKNSWAIVPMSIGHWLVKNNSNLQISEIEDAPPERIYYYIQHINYHSEYVDKFLCILQEHLETIPGIVVLLKSV